MMRAEDDFRIRPATLADIPAITDLIDRSVRQLQKDDYTQEQIDGALGHAFAVDTQLIHDGTYFLAECIDGQPRLAGCGGWSYRKPLCGGDHCGPRETASLDPAAEPAKIRAIFVHPDYARQGLGTLILKHCEGAAQLAGFRQFEMGSTLTGVPLYALKGYCECDRFEIPLPNGAALPVVHMLKTL
jgi:GNAT superfamily N-acetyltransferase